MLNQFQRMMMGLPGNPFDLQADQNSPSPPASGGGAGATAGGSVLPAVAAPMVDQYSNDDRQAVAFDKMGQLGMLLLAAGQNMTPQMRGQILSQGANVMGGTGQAMLNQAQARLAGAKAQEAQQDATRRDEFKRKVAADPSILAKLGITPDQYQLMGMDAVTKALEAQMSRDPTDIAYKNAMIEHLKNGNINDWQQVGEDAFGNKRYGVPSQIMRNGNNPTGQPTSIFDQLTGLTGEAALKKINEMDPGVGATVTGLVNGDIPYTASLIKSKRGEVIDALARIVDPSFSATTYDTRKKALMDQTSNQPNSAGGIRKNAETALRHFKALDENSFGLPENNLSIGSTLANSWDLAKLRRSGSNANPLATQLANYDNTLEIGGDEMAKALGIGSEGGREAIKKMFSPEQGKGIVQDKIKNQIRLLEEKLRVQDADWKRTMGPAANKLQIINPEMEDVFKTARLKPLTKDIRDRANASIRQGAKPDDVMQHLIDNGYDARLAP
jgi:hypothetical protein